MINKVMPLFGKRINSAVPETRFVLQVKSDNAGSSASNQFTIPTNGIGYNYDVETSDGYTATGLTGTHTITFPSGLGTHLVYISGDFPYIYFNNVGDRLKVLNVRDFIIYGLGSTIQTRAFRGCSNMDITATDAGNFQTVTDFSFAWTNCSSIVNFPLIDTSSGANFSNTWNGCSSLTSFPLLNTSSGTNFGASFANCSSLPSFPLIDMSGSTTFTFAWFGCTSLSNFPSNAFDGCLATNFSYAFTSTNLTTASIDNILVSINSNGTSGGTFNQTGGSDPSATGESAITAMRSRGWTVTVTGGF
jgi:hypothetical protein